MVPSHVRIVMGYGIGEVGPLTRVVPQGSFCEVLWGDRELWKRRNWGTPATGMTFVRLSTLDPDFGASRMTYGGVAATCKGPPSGMHNKCPRGSRYSIIKELGPQIHNIYIYIYVYVYKNVYVYVYTYMYIHMVSLPLIPQQSGI